MEIPQLCISIVSLFARSNPRKAVFTTSLQLKIINSLIARAFLLYILPPFSHIIYKYPKYIPEGVSAGQHEAEILL